jgi:thiol-disulfide isomerase/thioredoxin
VPLIARSATAVLLLCIGLPARGPSAVPSTTLAPGAAAPSWSNSSWLNADAPVRLESLRGRVVLLNFWVFTCGNCTRTVPSLRQFDARYRARGLTLIGIHTPEFPPYAGEHDRTNVARALKSLDIGYPVAQDNDRATWGLYDIRYWPSFVLIDKRGRIRHTGYGEFHIDDRWHRDWAAKIEALLAE